ncbi:MAG TPA: hypothetical protein VF193_11765 [Steroidobacter sp.]
MNVKRSLLAPALALLCAPSLADTEFYSAKYEARLDPEAGIIEMQLTLSGEKLPSRIELDIDPKRHKEFRASDPFDVEGERVTWRPRGHSSWLRYQFVVNHRRSSGGYDSLMNEDWALFRGDKLVPSVKVRAPKGLASRAELQFTLPEDWSIVTAYAGPEKRFEFDDPTRRFDRPKGWMLAGKISSRSERVRDLTVVVAAPVGNRTRRQDTLAFLRWTLPPLQDVFPTLAGRLLVVSGPDPLWRGGLSGPSSIFLHADRPLISENRTSTLLHEIVHVAMGIRSDEESDWIVEGLAELYSIEALRRSGTISERRYDEAIDRLERWGRRSRTLFTDDSGGATTARAVIALKAVDAEIRRVTNGKASLDEVARSLAQERGEVSLERLQKAAEKVAGRPLDSLRRERLLEPIPARER